MEKNYVSTSLLSKRFSFVKRKVRVPFKANSSSRTSFSYWFVENQEATRSLFLKFVAQLPATKGVALVLGINKDNSSSIIDLIDSPYNLQGDFLASKIIRGQKSIRRQKNISRYKWLRMQLEDSDFVSLKIQLAHAA